MYSYQKVLLQAKTEEQKTREAWERGYQVGVFLCTSCQFGIVLQRCITPCYYIACAFVQTSGSFDVQKIYFNHVYRNLNNNGKSFKT